jgi:hypothetical protein
MEGWGEVSINARLNKGTAKEPAKEPANIGRGKLKANPAQPLTLWGLPVAMVGGVESPLGHLIANRRQRRAAKARKKAR